MFRALVIATTLGSVVAFASVIPSAAQDRSLEQIEAERAQSEARRAELAAERARIDASVGEIKAEMIAVSRETDGLEAQTAELSERVAALALESEGLERGIASDRTSIAQLVATLQRIEANPPPAFVAGDTAIEAARAARLTATLAGQIKSRSDQLSQDLSELRSVRTQLEGEQVTLRTRQEALSARRAELRKLSAQKSALLRELDDEQAKAARRVAALASEAESLRELLARLEREAQAAPRIKPGQPRSLPGEIVPRIKPRQGGLPARVPLPTGLRFADARGQLGLPVRGAITTRFGPAHQGLAVRAGASAQVNSPYGGRVEFSGPFKNYQRLVILNAGDGYFVVLTGLGQTYVSSGETVAAGEPLGQMPGREASLYLEFRKDGRPIDPGPWLAPGVG